MGFLIVCQSDWEVIIYPCGGGRLASRGVAGVSQGGQPAAPHNPTVLIHRILSLPVKATGSDLLQRPFLCHQGFFHPPTWL